MTEFVQFLIGISILTLAVAGGYIHGRETTRREYATRLRILNRQARETARLVEHLEREQRHHGGNVHVLRNTATRR